MSKLTPEQEAKIAEYVRKSNAFSTGESRVCPTCGTPVTGAKLYAKIEPELFSLYVLPCNCRLGLWSKAPDWIENVKLITLEDQEDTYWERVEKERLARWNAAARGKAEGGQ